MVFREYLIIFPMQNKVCIEKAKNNGNLRCFFKMKNALIVI